MALVDGIPHLLSNHAADALRMLERRLRVRLVHRLGGPGGGAPAPSARPRRRLAAPALRPCDGPRPQHGAATGSSTRSTPTRAPIAPWPGSTTHMMVRAPAGRRAPGPDAAGDDRRGVGPHRGHAAALGAWAEALTAVPTSGDAALGRSRRRLGRGPLWRIDAERRGSATDCRCAARLTATGALAGAPVGQLHGPSADPATHPPTTSRPPDPRSRGRRGRRTSRPPSRSPR